MLPHPLSSAAHTLLTLYRAQLRDVDGVTPRYRDEVAGICRRYLLTLPGHDVEKTSPATCRSFFDYDASGAARAPGTRELYGGTVLRFLRWCNLEGHARIDPKVLRLKPPKAKHGPPRDLTAAQTEQLLDAAAKVDRRVLLGILLQEGAGLRRSEVTGIKDKKTGKHIGGRIEDCYLGHVGPWIQVTCKGSTRRVPLAPWLASILRVELAGRMQGPILANQLRPNEGICPQHYSELYRKVRRAAGLGSDVVPHRHRHTFATRLLQLEVLLPVIRDLLGHASVATTERYTGGYNPDLHAAVKRLPQPGRVRVNRTRPGNRRPRPTVASQPGVVGYRVRGRTRRRR